MKMSLLRPAMFLAVVACISITASAQAKPKLNTTPGYGEGKLLTFTYTQQYDCVEQPTDDLNFNGIPAEIDPVELQIPICQLGTQPMINPPGQKGNPLNTTEPLFILVPLFSTDNDQNPNDAISCANVTPGTMCGPALGSTLISLFGALPEGFKAKPLVYTQCPEPGSAPGTCAMHASRVDLGPVLVQLGYLPPPVSNVFVPTPNHSHVVLASDINVPAIWWQVRPVLVLSPSDWPSEDGKTGLASVKAIVEAIKAGTAVEAPSNFFLFFSSWVNGQHQMH